MVLRSLSGLRPSPTRRCVARAEGHRLRPTLLAKPWNPNHIRRRRRDPKRQPGRGCRGIGGNWIVGALTVSGNIAPGGGNPKENNATEIEGNSVKGLTTCATNNPAPINDGHKNTFTGAPTVGPPASPALPTSRQASSMVAVCSVDNSRKHAGHDGLVISSRSGAGGADGE